MKRPGQVLKAGHPHWSAAEYPVAVRSALSGPVSYTHLINDLILVDMRGQGKLHQNTVYLMIVVEFFHQIQQLLLRQVLRQRIFTREAVSYTHLDVYKRQVRCGSSQTQA